MISQSQIRTALAAADKPVMVESAAQLEKAAQAWQACNVIGIDTEFVRERTWRANLGLVQISDGERVWLVDPLKTGSLSPLAELLEDTHIEKVLHAPSEDLDVLLYTTGSVPQPLFDTQIACALLGQSLQMGYHKTVEWLLGIAIDKGQTRSNWCKRPLSPAQLHYAALDVCLLPIMYRQLHGRLQDLGREDWLREDCARMLDKALTPADPEQSWKRINGNGRLDGRSLAILQSLARWRDEEAERRNLARGFVVRDNALLTIANKQPDSIAALAELDVCHPRTLENHGPALLGAIDEVLQNGLTTRALEILKPEQRKLLAKMRQLVLEKAQELSIEPALLASKKELELLILSPPDEPVPERFQGWRDGIITQELLSIKDAFSG
jgi:ribonuclease D